MAECASAQVRLNDKTKSQQDELLRQIQEYCGLQPVEDYYYDDKHHSSVMMQGKTCVILDYELCSIEEKTNKL